MKIMCSIFLSFFASLVFGDATWELQTKLNSIRTMHASFEQKVIAKKHQVSQSSGVMALLRPGRFRWETKEPMAQLIIADGKKLWVYDVELEQVTVKKQERGMEGAAALFLSEYNEKDALSRDFKVTQSKQAEEESFDLHAKSKKANFQHVKLIFKQNILNGIELFDQLGQHTEVKLTNAKINSELALTLFKFIPPTGVDVIKQ